jgi:short-subunit dehydrogenase
VFGTSRNAPESPIDDGSGTIEMIRMDVDQDESVQYAVDHIMSKTGRIDVVVNNAGFGGHGLFYEREWSKDKDMIQVNVTSLVELTRLFLPEMVARKSGRILNTASTAAFLPGPLQAVYYATKSFVVSFSQAIAEELRSQNTNVTVTALCPGAVATEFVAAGDLDGVDVWKNAKSPASVAKVGYDAMMRGKLVAINQFSLKMIADWVFPFMPRRTLLKMSRQSMEKSN